MRSALPSQPVDRLQVIRHRLPLLRARAAIAAGRLNVGFIGGSITAGWEHNWPTPVTGWLTEGCPQVFLAAENAAIGATGSDSGCLRAEREIIRRDCHLTFVEYAVNDRGHDTERRGRTREGLIRKLLAAGQDVVLVYTFCQEMYADMIAGRVPASVADFEVLAGHYGLGSVWMGLHALNDVRAGRMTWEEWLPDGLHPGHRGSWSYAQPVIEYLRRELLEPAAAEARPSLPAPLFPKNWQSATELPLTDVRASGPWVLRRVNEKSHVDQFLETSTPGARLEFSFHGRGLALIFDYGKKSAEFNYRIDGGEWTPVVRERPEWCGDRGLVRALLISDELSPGPHTFEMEVTHGDRADCAGTECRLAHIGVL